MSYTRRVTLPSGRRIDVVYHDPTTAAACDDDSLDDLRLCPECDRDLVYPVTWREISETHHEVELRCPNCEWREVDRHDQATLDYFDEMLNRAGDAVVRELRRLTRENMVGEIDRFAAALSVDAILPEDFR